MTDLPTISYGIGYQDDFSDLPPNAASSADPLDSLIQQIRYNDWMQLYGVPNHPVHDEWQSRYSQCAGSVGSTLYNKWRCRLKTEASNPGLGAAVIIQYTDGAFETLVPIGTFTDNFFKVFSGNLAQTGKVVGHIFYYIDDYPNSVAAGGSSVYYDFFMLYKGDFKLPNVAFGAEFSPPPRYAKKAAPSRITDVIQGMGGESATFNCTCDLDIDSGVAGDEGNWKRLTDVRKAQVIHEISHELSTTVDFVWLNTGEEQFKAIMERPIFHRYGNRRELSLMFTEYSRCNASHYNYLERFGLNL
jgi:hypothetical protein